jgi:MFS family permease
VTDLLHEDLAVLRARRGAIAGAFFVQGFLFIALTLRLPTIQRLFDLSELALSGLMLLMVLLAGVGSVLAEQVAARVDSARALRVALLTITLGIALLGFGVRGSGSFPLFVAGLSIYGLGVGANDAASNMQAVALEHRLGHPVMPSFHGAWTFGGLLATILTIALPHLEVAHAAWVVCVLPVAMLFAPLLGRDHGIVADPENVAVPWRPIILVGVALVLFYMVDTAATAWGPVYLSSDHVFAHPPTSSAMFALATLPYLSATLLARLAGDWATNRFGAPVMVRVGALLAAGGLAVVVFAPASTWQVAILGFFIVGLGVAVIAPLSFSAAARIAGGDADAATRQARVDAVIARFNQFNYVGALLGAVLTGAIGNGNLRVGYAVPMVLILALLPLAKHFGRPAHDGATQAVGRHTVK